jgi:hypothetical protein
MRVNQPDLPWPPLEEQVDRYLTKLVGLGRTVASAEPRKQEPPAPAPGVSAAG